MRNGNTSGGKEFAITASSEVPLRVSASSRTFERTHAADQD